MSTSHLPYPLLILYGSQTGNAQDVAELIAREAERRYFCPRVLSADAYARTALADLPAEPAIVAVVSTTGQGDAPDNITELWRFLRRKSLGPDSLEGVAAAVFGLGDSAYLKYNVMAKLLYRRLGALGAAPLVPLGLGDDQHRSGYDAALDEWLPQLWTALRAKFPLQPGMAELPASSLAAQLHSKYRIVAVPPPADGSKSGRDPFNYEDAAAAAAAMEGMDEVAVASSSSGEGGPSAAAPLFARLAANVKVTANSHFQDVRMLDIDLGTASGMDFAPGDVIAVRPRQREASLAAFCARCGLDPHSWVEVHPMGVKSSIEDGSTNVNAGITLRVGAIVAGVLDVDAAGPRRVFFQALNQHTPPGPHADRLAHFASPMGRDDLHEYCRREGRTVLEILADFPTASLSLEWLLSYAPRLRPRRFSVASALALRPGAAQLLVAAVEWQTPGGRRRRRGLCSTWLAGLAPGEAVAVWAEQGALRPPPNLTTPMILVGPGTGVAPFRSFLQHRQSAAKQGASPAPCVLFFGCRSEAGDYYCRQEWEEMQREGILGGECGGGLVTAFSRDSDKKVYVTHRIREHGAAVWALLQAGAWVYVAGSADRMPADVATALRDVAVEHGGMDAAAATRFYSRLEALGRYQVECWS